jgi:hypothetical protein
MSFRAGVQPFGVWQAEQSRLSRIAPWGLSVSPGARAARVLRGVAESLTWANAGVDVATSSDKKAIPERGFLGLGQ